MRAAILALALFGLCPTLRAAMRFPIGIHGVTEPKHLAALREAGLDSIVPYPQDFPELSVLAREAKRLGMRMLLPNGRLLARPASETSNWPVEAWYLIDEPEVQRLSPDAVAGLSRRTKEWDPARLQFLNLSRGSAARDYGAIADIISIDWYPVPHLKLDSVADQIDSAMSHLPTGKPLWVVLQAFDWRDASKKQPPVGRFPTHEEIRFMTYLSIVHGARGIFYFQLRKPGDRTLLDVPEHWQAVSRVTQELSALQPMLEKGRPVALPFSPASTAIEGRAWRWRGRDYVILLNRSPAHAALPSEFFSPRWRALFEPRRNPQDALSMLGEEPALKPYQALILESRLSTRGGLKESSP